MKNIKVDGKFGVKFNMAPEYGVFFILPLAISLMYTSNKWNRWYRYFTRGNASKVDFMEAVKWSVISFVIALGTIPFLWMFRK